MTKYYRPSPQSVLEAFARIGREDLYFHHPDYKRQEPVINHLINEGLAEIKKIGDDNGYVKLTEKGEEKYLVLTNLVSNGNDDLS